MSAVNELPKSWLVQRLEKPRPAASGKLAAFGGGNPFAFGGGLKNGGLTDEAMGLLRDIFAFDYMGAAEFEFGAVPETLNRIANSALARFSFTIPLREVAPNWRDKSKAKPEGAATVYVLCAAGLEASVEERVRAFAQDEYYALKEPTKLNLALRPVAEWDSETCGWLELNNGFFFFTDETMWARTCELFGAPGD